MKQPLTLNNITNLLEAEFSEEGSNNRRFEKCCQCKNYEEPEGSSKSVEWFSIEGRKTKTKVTISPFPTHKAWLIQIQFHLNSKYKPLFTYSDNSFLYNLQVEGELQYLSHILQFKTGAEEEPVMRFVLHLRLQFVEVTTTFISTANTCINCLNLPHPFRDIPLLSENKLFNLYDLVLSNACFGHV